jgi:putative endonuclease
MAKLPATSALVEQKNMKGYVYILKDSTGKFYVGSTNNLERRFKQHNSGHTYTTRRMGELELVFSQEFDTLEKARNIELKLKRLKRKDYIRKIVEDGYIKILPA